jgi:hypothetical protein
VSAPVVEPQQPTYAEAYCNCRKGGGGFHDPGPGCFAWDLAEQRIIAIIEDYDFQRDTWRRDLLAAIKEHR